MARDLLFINYSLSDLFRGLKEKLKNEVENLQSDYVLKVSVSDLCQHFVDKYALEPPILQEHYMLDLENANIDIRGMHHRFVSSSYGPSHVKGTEITVVVPFEGDAKLFQFQPNPHHLGNAPSGTVFDNEIHITYESLGQNEDDWERLRKDIEKNVEDIKWHVGNMKNNIEQFNKELEPWTKEYVSKRRERALNERKMVAHLGIPIKRREDAAKTYTIPTERRKPKIERPKVETEKPFEPEPAMDMAIYENVLSIAQNMTRVMECSPHSFTTMNEEDIRQHFLVQLNAQYKGEGVAEAFNYEGKTDILMRHKGKNVFIAECKFWKGPKSLTDAIDQLLSYTSWRDTKTAIFLFNRRKNFSAVLEKIPSVVKEQPCYKQDLESKEETVFKYRFHHRDDANRELHLTIMAFNVPKEGK
jgi:hypothetical protein